MVIGNREFDWLEEKECDWLGKREFVWLAEKERDWLEENVIG